MRVPAPNIYVIHWYLAAKSRFPSVNDRWPQILTRCHQYKISQLSYAYVYVMTNCFKRVLFDPVQYMNSLIIPSSYVHHRNFAVYFPTYEIASSRCHGHSLSWPRAYQRPPIQNFSTKLCIRLCYGKMFQEGIV